MRVITETFGTWGEHKRLKEAFIIRNGIGEWLAEITIDRNDVHILGNFATKNQAEEAANNFIKNL